MCRPKCLSALRRIISTYIAPKILLALLANKKGEGILRLFTSYL